MAQRGVRRSGPAIKSPRVPTLLLLALLGLVFWLKASGELPVHRRMVFASGAINPCVMPALRRLAESRSAPLIDTVQFLKTDNALGYISVA